MHNTATESAPRYKAVVESGSSSQDYRYWEERRTCGHLHKSYAAAEACGRRLGAERYVNGSWQANADWYHYRIHNQAGERISPDGVTEWAARAEVQA